MPPPPLIACVDDDASVREALEGLLRAFRFEVVMFTSAEEFLGFERQEAISCLITDVKLGGISGLQLLERLKRMPHRIPAIVITAFSDEISREKAIDTGAVDFLQKPIAPEKLLAALNRALGSLPSRPG